MQNLSALALSLYMHVPVYSALVVRSETSLYYGSAQAKFLVTTYYTFPTSVVNFRIDIHLVRLFILLGWLCELLGNSLL